MPLIPEDYLDLLQSTALAHLATIGPQGEPQVSAVWFGWDGTSILFGLKKERQKFRNVVREPRVALAIVDPANPYRSLEIRGVVARIEGDADYGVLNALSRKYLGRDATREEGGPGEDRAAVFVEPRRVIVFPPREAKTE